MRIAQEQVEQFMRKIGDVVNEKPTTVDTDTGARRYKLIAEELSEYLTANDKQDLVGVADALGDLLYTVLGLAVLHGIDAQMIFEEVHKSNMTKTPSKTNGFKLCTKGPDFKPPQIAAALLLQHTGLVDAVVL